jgi:two-component system phosphate regulon sensor histidine kinase PhoR
MRSYILKWLVLISTLVIGLIILIQLYWINQVYTLEKRQFNTNVVKSIRGLFEDTDLNEPISQVQNSIFQPDANSFLVKIGTIPSKDTLLHYLAQELSDFDVLTDCKVAVYDHRKAGFVFEEYIPAPASHFSAINVPDLKMATYTYDYLLLNFPHRGKYVLSQMNFWIITSATLLLVLIGFAVGLFYFYKQKFLAETQKDFVNNFTHEFKTPLAVMKIASDVLLQPNIAEQPERLTRYASIIQNQTEHLQMQVEKLLKVASSERHVLQLEEKKVEVDHLIKQAVSKVLPLVEQTQAKLEYKLDEKQYTIMADEAHLELAIVNLLENGIKYSTKPHLVIETGQLDNEFFISVKDNGIGIEKKYQKGLFKKFYRVPTGDVHNVKGFGLGLNFVKKVVDAHKGRILVNSLPGIGTEFKILLPYSNHT